MEYLKWNNLIAKQYFNSSMAGREVLLYVNAEVINKIGEAQNSGVNDFIETIKAGPPWATGGSLCNKAFRAYNKWRTRGVDYPPYLSYLVFFVLAGVTETGRAPHSYYPGIWKLLGDEEDRGSPKNFDTMITLWDDLEKWSREDKNEELGRFVARIRGGWINVGLPRSQTILSENERKNLSALFRDTGLDPTDPPTPEYLQILLSCYGQTYLENRTRKLIESNAAEDEVLKIALLELVTEELENWNGTVHEQFARDNIRRQYKQTILRCVSSKLSPFFSNEVPSSTAQFSHGLRRAIGGPFSAMRKLCYTVPYSNGYTACLSAVFSIFCRLNFFKVTIVPGSQFLVLPDHLSGCFDLAF